MVFIRLESILRAVEQYTLVTERPLDDYLGLVRFNMTEKMTHTGWCEKEKYYLALKNILIYILDVKDEV